jgi:Flp pilus assembly protein TadD
VLFRSTGFFIKEEGLLVTNRHVIDGKVKVLAKLSSGEFFPVEGVLSEDRNGDLVLLTLGIKGRSFPTLSLTDTVIETGQPIIVIGSPLGHEGTVAKGIVSEVKDIPNFGKVFQHTAPISKGSSGSPVLNMKGEVIGVVVGYSIVEGESLNFAISVDRVKGLLSHGQARPRELVELVDREEEIWIGQLLNGRYEELINHLKMRIKRSPNNAKAHFYLGLAFARLSRSNEAIEAYKGAIRIEPDDSDFYYNLGVSYIRLGNHNEAIKAFKQSVRIKPDDAKAFLNLGFSYGELNRYKEAIKVYKDAIRIKADFAEAHYNRGEAYLKVKKKKKAIEQYEIVKNLDSELGNKLFNLIYK